MRYKILTINILIDIHIIRQIVVRIIRIKVSRSVGIIVLKHIISQTGSDNALIQRPIAPIQLISYYRISSSLIYKTVLYRYIQKLINDIVIKHHPHRINIGVNSILTGQLRRITHERSDRVIRKLVMTYRSLTKCGWRIGVLSVIPITGEIRLTLNGFRRPIVFRQRIYYILPLWSSRWYPDLAWIIQLKISRILIGRLPISEITVLIWSGSAISGFISTWDTFRLIGNKSS